MLLQSDIQVNTRQFCSLHTEFILNFGILLDESSAVGQFGADAPSGLRAASTAHEEEPAAEAGERTERSKQLPRDTSVTDPLHGAETAA